MANRQYKAKMRRFYTDVFEKGKIDTVDKLASPGFKDHDPSNPAGDLKGAKEAMMMFRKAFPDIKIAVHDIFDSGNKVVARFTMTGTHRGEFMGIKPTNKKIKVTGIDIVRFARGKAVEHWGEVDSAGMMQQLGLGGPAPAPSKSKKK